MSEYSIGRAGPGDLVAVVRLIERQPKLSAAAVTERQQATWARMMATDYLTVYVAWHGSDAVGTTALLVMPHITYSCRPTAFIESMYVRDEHRRRGVARMMVERLLNDATSAGCHKVQLLTHKRHADDGAHTFYRSLGFEAEAEGFRLYLTEPIDQREASTARRQAPNLPPDGAQ
jgi:GNAT superfamily N-acetyltransferase